MLLERLKAIRHASYVERCHTEMTIGNQTLGHHQYNVAMIARLITNGEASASLICSCLDHDVPEHITGDSPGHTKLANPPLAKALETIEEKFFLHHKGFFHRSEQLILDDERRVLKLSDSLELAYFCCEQRMLGNKWVDNMYSNVMRVVRNSPWPSNTEWSTNASQLVMEAQRRWEEAVL